MRGPGDNSTDRSHSVKCVAYNMYNVCISAFFGDFFYKEKGGRNRMRGPGANSADESHSIKCVASDIYNAMQWA